MRGYLTGLLGGLSPRRQSPPAATARLFERFPAIHHLHAVTTTQDGSIWIAADGGLHDLARNRLIPLPDAADPEGQGLRFVAGESFLVAGGPSGLWWLVGGQLAPVEPREEVLALAADETIVAAVTRDDFGQARLRVCRGPDRQWLERWRPPGEISALALGPEETVLAGGEGLWCVRGRGDAQEVELPKGCGRISRVLIEDEMVWLSDGDTAWLGEGLCPSHWNQLSESASPGPFAGGMALGRVGNVHARTGEALVQQSAPEPFAKERLIPAGPGPRDTGLAHCPTGLLEAGRRKWKPLLVAGLAPASARCFQRTRGGATWVVDRQGRLFHQSGQGVWSRMMFPEGFQVSGDDIGADGEGALIPAADPEREYQAGETLFWVAAPRGEELGKRVFREPKPVSLGPLSGREVSCVAGLGAIVFAAVGARLVRIEDEVVEVWGSEQGLPDTPVMSLETMFDDLWVACLGDAGPRRYPQGVADSDPIPGSGPSGEVQCMCADEDTGELWVGLADGAKGGVASLSREGRWISQLRFRAPVKGVAAAGGTVLAASRLGLFVLEEGERLRRQFNSGDGLPPGGCSAVGLTQGVALVDTAWGLYRSQLEAWKPPEPGGLQV